MSIDRRTVLQVGGLAVAGGVLAACSGSGTDTPTTPAASAPGTAAPGGTASGSAGAGVPLTPAADVPVSGGVILQDQAVVVTQPSAGTFKAFSAICTHEGCLVASVENNEIICPCHGARFSAEDGSVLQGPATQPLAEGAVTVSDGTVVLSS